jgi:1-hydroxycarotenoid 3,4-desaturase
MRAVSRAIVIGAGIGGLSAAVGLARKGARPLVLERAGAVGGKMRTIEVGGRAIDSGPTVLTMRSVFDRLFADAGTRLDEHLQLSPLRVLARHAWTDGTQLDLFTDLPRSEAAITSAFGAEAARDYRGFCTYAERIWKTVEDPFMTGPRPSLLGMIGAMGLRGITAATRIDFRRSMWKALGEHFREPKLRQLFARYATYYGSDPFRAPATLNLIAHVEREGVWVVEGGMHGLARELGALAERLGATIRTDAEVREIVVEGGRAVGVALADGERIDADAIVLNADPWALVEGRFGSEVSGSVDVVAKAGRSLSAMTWSMAVSHSGFPLLHHDVFFSDDYAREFEELASGRFPSSPTVYVCAQHVGAGEENGVERGDGHLLVLVNAPPRGDAGFPEDRERARCDEATWAQLARCGLTLGAGKQAVVTTPREFEALFPSTGGALYGPATHGWRAAFSRPGCRTKTTGLYLAGAGAHPGAGVPLVALSGQFAAQTVVEDLGLTS